MSAMWRLLPSAWDTLWADCHLSPPSPMEKRGTDLFLKKYICPLFFIIRTIGDDRRNRSVRTCVKACQLMRLGLDHRYFKIMV